MNSAISVRAACSRATTDSHDVEIFHSNALSIEMMWVDVITVADTVGIGESCVDITDSEWRDMSGDIGATAEGAVISFTVHATKRAFTCADITAPIADLGLAIHL